MKLGVVASRHRRTSAQNCQGRERGHQEGNGCVHGPALSAVFESGSISGFALGSRWIWILARREFNRKQGKTPPLELTAASRSAVSLGRCRESGSRHSDKRERWP